MRSPASGENVLLQGSRQVSRGPQGGGQAHIDEEPLCSRVRCHSAVLSTHRGRWIEQQGARLSPRGLLPLQQACERPLCWSADRHRRVELWCAQGAMVALQGRPSSEYQAHLVLSWIFSPDFESRKTGQREIMRKNRLLCNECPAHTFQSIHDVGMIEWRRYQCYIKVWKILQNKYQMV